MKQKDDVLDFKSIEELEAALDKSFAQLVELRDKSQEALGFFLQIKHAVQIMRLRDEAKESARSV